MNVNPSIIPAWNSAGVMPPIRPGVQGNSSDRSPYRVELPAFVDRFATSPERMAILDGLLRFRAGLHKAGIVAGFQWLDGSFLEQVEIIEERAPRDMDAVNFIDLTGVDQAELARQHTALFDHEKVKTDYRIDAYFMQTGGQLDEATIRRISYWYSMWSHRRDGLWKGFVQIDLSPTQDAEARAILSLAGGIDHE